LYSNTPDYTNTKSLCDALRYSTYSTPRI